MDDILTAISTVGFPIASAAYLLLRMEAKLDKLSEVITGLNVQVQMLRNDLNQDKKS